MAKWSYTNLPNLEWSALLIVLKNRDAAHYSETYRRCCAPSNISVTWSWSISIRQCRWVIWKLIDFNYHAFDWTLRPLGKFQNVLDGTCSYLPNILWFISTYRSLNQIGEMNLKGVIHRTELGKGLDYLSVNISYWMLAVLNRNKWNLTRYSCEFMNIRNRCALTIERRNPFGLNYVLCIYCEIKSSCYHSKRYSENSCNLRWANGSKIDSWIKRASMLLES